MSRRTQWIVLALALAVLAAVVYYQRSRAADSGLTAAAASPATAGAARRSSAQDLAPVPQVRLDALAAARSEPAPPVTGRNLFQFQPKVAPPPAAMARAASPAGAENLTPPPPPPPPPIPYKFIGIVQAPDKKIAVLTDVSTRDVFYGREGEVIDGRYRILRIGVESIEMAYVDGRGRQTIRLTGS